jgi:membrane-bound lytic murein transglycosylase B
MHAIDADTDGILDPYDLDDSALTLARLLCSGEEDLRTADGWNAAVGRYHPGASYARSVFQAADDYGQRTRNIG